MAVPTLCLMVASYFVISALFGPTGYFALDNIREARATYDARKTQLEAQRAALQRDIQLLDPKGADPDFADELVRRHLGVVRPDEVIVQLD